MPSRRLALAMAALAVALTPSAARATKLSAYAMDSTGSGGVFQYDVFTDGFLGAKPAERPPSGVATQAMAVVPNAAYAYVAAASGGLYPFSIGSNGQLQSLGSPAAAGTNTMSVAVSPDGQSVYAADKGGDAIYQYSVGGGGVLVPKSPASVPAGTDPTSVAVSPDGSAVYAVNTTSHDVYTWGVGAGGTLLTPPTIVSAGTAPSTIVLAPNGSSAYVTDTGGGRVLQYDVSHGQLSPKSQGPVATGASPTGIVVSPNGLYAYVANSGDGTVTQYGMDGHGGLVSNLTTKLVGGAVPQQLALSSNGNRLFVPDAAGGHNVLYEFDSTGGSLDGTSSRFIDGGSTPVAVTVAPDQGPVADFTATPGVPGAPTAFDARASTDSDGSVTHYFWDFGDGTGVDNDAGPTPTHTYPGAGTFFVTLRVSDNGGCSTARLFTGRTAHCNGNPGAIVTKPVTVSPAPLGTPVFFAGVAAHNQTVRVSKGGLARISVRCPRGTFGSCIGTLGLVTAGKVRVPRKGKARGAAKRLLMGQAGFNITSGKAVKIPVQISKAGRKVLARRRVLKTNATINAHDRLMTSRKTAFSVRLKSPKPPRRHR